MVTGAVVEMVTGAVVEVVTGAVVEMVTGAGGVEMVTGAGGVEMVIGAVGLKWRRQEYTSICLVLKLMLNAPFTAEPFALFSSMSNVRP